MLFEAQPEVGRNDTSHWLAVHFLLIIIGITHAGLEPCLISELILLPVCRVFSIFPAHLSIS